GARRAERARPRGRSARPAPVRPRRGAAESQRTLAERAAGEELELRGYHLPNGRGHALIRPAVPSRRAPANAFRRSREPWNSVAACTKDRRRGGMQAPLSDHGRPRRTTPSRLYARVRRAAAPLLAAVPLAACYAS